MFSDIQSWQSFRNGAVGPIGFVPTMGGLHEGHASLLQQSIAENKLTALSIFVNPMQFDDVSDLENYPRTLDQDLALAEKLGVDAVIVPSEKAMYPVDYRYQLDEKQLSHVMEGKYRQGHFAGVLTIVMKLFNLVKPDRAYFGEKDYQQYQLIKDMTQAFFMDVAVIGCPIQRDSNGFALSSRNSRLSEKDYQLALNFSKFLSEGKRCEDIKSDLESLGIEVEYIEEYFGRRYGAVRVGGVRLIDNFSLNSI